MNKNHFAAISKVSPAPARMSASRIVAVCAVVAAVVMGITVWWVSDPVSDQESLHPKLTMDTPYRASAPAPSSEYPSVVQPAGTDSGVAAYRFEPPGDLLAAIKRAQAATGNSTLSPPAGKSSWQGMSHKDAAKVFEDAIKADHQPSSAVMVSPFGPAMN